MCSSDLGKEEYTPSYEEILKIMLKHIDLACQMKGDRIAIKEMRKHIAWYLRGFKGSNEIKNKVNIMLDREEIKKLLESYLLSL